MDDQHFQSIWPKFLWLYDHSLSLDEMVLHDALLFAILVIFDTSYSAYFYYTIYLSHKDLSCILDSQNFLP